MIQQATSINITLRAIERVCDKFDIKLKESHKTILAILIPAIIYRDGKIIILAETVHQINRALKKHNEKIDFVSMLLAYNCITNIDKYGVITIPLALLLEKLVVRREIVGSKFDTHLTKKVLTNPSTTLCVSEVLNHVGIPFFISIPVINIFLELVFTDINAEYKSMVQSNIGFKGQKMSHVKKILKQMQFEKIFLSTAILLVVTHIGFKIGTSMILVSILDELYYIIKAEYKEKTVKGVLK